MKKTALNIPSITQSLRMDYEKGIITPKEIAEELNIANLTPYLYSDEEVMEYLYKDRF